MSAFIILLTSNIDLTYWSIIAFIVESATLEILSQKTRSSGENVIYIPHNGSLELFIIFITTFFQTEKILTEMFMLHKITILTYWTMISVKRCRPI